MNLKQIKETIKYFIMKDYYRNLLRFQKLKFSRWEHDKCRLYKISIDKIK